LDGPALVDPDGGEEWWLNGQKLGEEEVKKARAILLTGHAYEEMKKNFPEKVTF
jgi:hypothetical protein